MDVPNEARADAETAPGLERDMPNCSIARTLEIVGEKWTILILREVWYGSSRFGDFERVLGCPRNLLATRLRKLVEEGVLATEKYKEPGTRSRPKCVITPEGIDLVPAVIGLMRWGDRHCSAPDGSPLLMRHHACGAHVEVRLRCLEGHPVPVEELDRVPGPGFRTKPVERDG